MAHPPKDHPIIAPVRWRIVRGVTIKARAAVSGITTLDHPNSRSRVILSPRVSESLPAAACASPSHDVDDDRGDHTASGGSLLYFRFVIFHLTHTRGVCASCAFAKWPPAARGASSKVEERVRMMSWFFFLIKQRINVRAERVKEMKRRG